MLKIPIIVFLAFIFSFSKMNAQACLMRFDRKIVCWENFSFKDTLNGKINLFNNEKPTKKIALQSFLGVFIKKDSFLLLHDSSYLVKNASIDFYKNHLKKITINPKGNNFFYDNMVINRKYVINTAFNFNDKTIKKTNRQYNSLTILKTVFTATFICGLPGLVWIPLGYILSPDFLNMGVIAVAASAVSVGSIILINKKQRKLNKKLIERYNSLLLQP